MRATLQHLVAEGLGPALGLNGDWRMRSAIERNARLGPEQLRHRLDTICREHCDGLVGYAQRLLRNRDDAEDAVSEAFARVLRSDPDLVAPEALVGYLRAAVRNQAFDRGKANTRAPRARAPGAAGDGAEVVDIEGYLAAPDRPLDDRVCDEVTLAVALHVLSARQRQCFALRFVEGLSVSETATRLSISDGNVKRICSETRTRLAAALAA